MNSKAKQQLINDVLTGLVVAAVLGVVEPGLALATANVNLQSAVGSAQGQLAAPFITVVSYISYGLGAVMSVAGIANAKKHADAPGQHPLGPALGKIGAGAAFLAAPYLIANLLGTGTSTLGEGSATFKDIGGFGG